MDFNAETQRLRELRRGRDLGERSYPAGRSLRVTTDMEILARQKGIVRMKLLVTLKTDETGTIVAECPSIPGCVSQGYTEDEAMENIREQ